MQGLGVGLSPGPACDRPREQGCRLSSPTGVRLGLSRFERKVGLDVAVTLVLEVAGNSDGESYAEI